MKFVLVRLSIALCLASVPGGCGKNILFDRDRSVDWVLDRPVRDFEIVSIEIYAEIVPSKPGKIYYEKDLENTLRLIKGASSESDLEELTRCLQESVGGKRSLGGSEERLACLIIIREKDRRLPMGFYCWRSRKDPNVVEMKPLSGGTITAENECLMYYLESWL